MTYAEIFREIYRNHKLGLKIYVMLAAFVSVVLAANGNLVYAAETAGVAATVGTLGGVFGKCFGPVAESSLASLDVSSVMALSSLVSIIVQYVPQEFFDTIHLSYAKQYSFGLLDFWPVRVFCFLWFIVSWLSRSSMVSESWGVALENVESVLGGIVNIAVVVSQIFMNVPPMTKAMAADTVTTATGNTFVNVLMGIGTGLLCFIVLIFCAVSYLFVRLFCLYVDVILVPICSFIPCSAVAINVGKFIGIVLLGLLAIFAPYVFIVIYIAILVLSIIFFKKAYTGVKYFTNIYTKPLLARIGGYRIDMPLIAEKLPKKLVKKENLDDASVVIPVYLQRKLTKVAKRHTKWFFIVNSTGAYLCKIRGGKKENYRIDLTNSLEHKMFIKKSVRFFEIFNLRSGEENLGKSFRRIPKNIHFVFSKEYYYRFDELKAITEYTDYTEYWNEKSAEYKQTKKAIREQKRMERQEAREERLLAFFGNEQEDL